MVVHLCGLKQTWATNRWKLSRESIITV